MNSVFVLHHLHSDDEYGDDAKFIGVYRSRANAEAAIARLSVQPGFRDHCHGFTIDEYELDKDHWCEGFVSGSQ